jgi:uncharacterized membrane protein YqhA
MPQGPDEDRTDDSRVSNGWATVVRTGRFIMVIPALVLYVVTLGLVTLGAIQTVDTVIKWIAGDLSRKEVLLDFTEVVDAFLLASVAYVIGLGLLYLFVDNSAPLPKWLRLTGLDDLKEKLIAVVVAALAVGFLGSSIRLAASIELVYAGIASGVMVAALGLFLYFTKAKKT